jgi:hypothetical protein
MIGVLVQYVGRMLWGGAAAAPWLFGSVVSMVNQAIAGPTLANEALSGPRFTDEELV